MLINVVVCYSGCVVCFFQLMSFVCRRFIVCQRSSVVFGLRFRVFYLWCRLVLYIYVGVFFFFVFFLSLVVFGLMMLGGMFSVSLFFMMFVFECFVFMYLIEILFVICFLISWMFWLILLFRLFCVEILIRYLIEVWIRQVLLQMMFFGRVLFFLDSFLIFVVQLIFGVVFIL